MKRAFTLAAALLALSAAALDEAVERRLGDDAFRSGDYQNSINFYANALRLSIGDADAWQVNALKLATARLRSGDTAGARRDLEEFRERFPASTAGTLPGEILLAEHRFREAELFSRRWPRGSPKRPGRRNFWRRWPSSGRDAAWRPPSILKCWRKALRRTNGAAARSWRASTP